MHARRIAALAAATGGFSSSLAAITLGVIVGCDGPSTARPSVVANTDIPAALAVSGGNVYWASANSIESPGRTVSSSLPSSGSALAANSTTLYWGGLGGLVMIDLATGHSKVLA